MKLKLILIQLNYIMNIMKHNNKNNKKHRMNFKDIQDKPKMATQKQLQEFILYLQPIFIDKKHRMNF